MHSSRYILVFVLLLTGTVALLLSLMATSLKPIHDFNEKIYNKKAVLSSVNSELESAATAMSNEEVQSIFDSQVQQIVVDAQGNEIPGLLAEDIDMAKERKKPESERRYPVYIFNSGGEKFYILSIRGNGLWDEIWGSVALKDDLNTIVGVAFDHKGETPGLGAEIKDNPSFAAQFPGKKIYAEDGEYTSVTVRKGGAKNDRNEVDAISGATVTSDGVTDMLYDGIKRYEPYFEEVESTTN